MSTQETGYQGWKNYETFSVALAIDNDSGDLDNACEIARENNEPLDCGLEIRRLVEESAQNLLDEPTLAATLLNAALDRVDWREVGQHYITAVTEEASAAQ